MNTLGRTLRLSILGESHGRGVGALLDGVPAGIPVDLDRIQAALDRRRPGTSELVSSRQETDRIQVRTGVHEGRTTGAPILLWIDNVDTRPRDYDLVQHLPRPGHADLLEHLVSGGHNDPRGGGHTSGRLTAGIVAGAALLEPWLDSFGLTVGAHLRNVGEVELKEARTVADAQAWWDAGEVPFAKHQGSVDPAAERAVQVIQAARSERNSIGARVHLVAEGVPPLLGSPWFASLESDLAAAIFGIPAVRAVEFGEGVESAKWDGMNHNDAWLPGNPPTTRTNHHGGILGGRSTGMPIRMDVTIKPTSSIFQSQDTVDLRTGASGVLNLTGRHDPCIGIRAVPVLRAVLQWVLADHLLQRLGTRTVHDAPEGASEP